MTSLWSIVKGTYIWSHQPTVIYLWTTHPYWISVHFFMCSGMLMKSCSWIYSCIWALLQIFFFLNSLWLQNVCFPAAHQVGNVKCRGCDVLLMYPYGAPSVRCSCCRSVTEIDVSSNVLIAYSTLHCTVVTVFLI